MTKNNLEEHLRWFRQTKPATPAAGLQLPPAGWDFDQPLHDTGADVNALDEFDDDLDDAVFALPVAVPPMAPPPRPLVSVASTGLPPADKRRSTVSSLSDSDIEVLDMTTGIASSTSSKTSEQRPRKRKSEELVEAPTRNTTVANPRSDVDFQQGSPPPYSTIPPTVHKVFDTVALQRIESTQLPRESAPATRYRSGSPSNRLGTVGFDNDDDLFNFTGCSPNVTVERGSPARKKTKGIAIEATGGNGSPSTPLMRDFSKPASTQPCLISRNDLAELESFFAIKQHRFGQVLASIQHERDELSNKAVNMMEDGCDDVDGIYTKLDDLDAAATAIQSLWQCRAEIQRLSERRNECRTALIRHVRDNRGRDMEVLKQANNDAKSELEAFQARCLIDYNKCRAYVFTLLGEAGPRIPSDGASRTAEKTLAPPASRRSSLDEGIDAAQMVDLRHESTSARSTSIAQSTARKLHDYDAAGRYQLDLTRTLTNTLPQQFTPRSPREVYDDFGPDFDAQDLHGEGYGRSTTHSTPLPARKALSEISHNAGSALRNKSHKQAKAAVKHSSQAAVDDLFCHPWSDDVKRVLKERFKLQGFRQGQLEAINATLAGQDTFVLMPTGGGKSLCYQLPSQIDSGKTQGLTIVISPLLSLMEDQVQHMQDLNIQALFVNGSSSKDERSRVLSTLRRHDVQDELQVLYVTPEMLSKSAAMVSAIEQLYDNNRFARLVIDEAHCVSQWGHDFRPDYKLIGDFRRKFPSVPVMALTATATENVKADTIHNLGIQGCKVMNRSFNRPNLYYEIRAKGKAKDDEANIAELIKNKHKGQSGIIYCLSRRNCEDLATGLRKLKIRAQHYHAQLTPAEKSEVQKGWQNGKYHVIVATIAFGMGIDKANVRYVIHNSLPKSLEGYYQETGRAGRDGLASSCYLFFGFQDVGKLRRMIDGSEDASYEQKQRQHEMLRRMVQYCANKIDCRRVQVLSYFSEAFDEEGCQKKCDNCNSGSTFRQQDVTALANAAVDLVRSVQDSNKTMLYCIDLFRGAKKKRGAEESEYSGAGQELEREDVERLFASLLAQGVLKENQVVNGGGFPVQYAAVNPSSRPVSNFYLSIRSSPKKTTKRQQSEMPLSTNVSSPVRAQPKSRSRPIKQDQRITQYAFNLDDDADGDVNDSDGFEQQEASARKSKPISIEDMIAGLDAWHAIAVEDFLVSAKEQVDIITKKNNLRLVIFSDTVLRLMALHFTTDLDAMKKLPGINKAHVDKYGSRFCKLVKDVKASYDEHIKADPIAPRKQAYQDPNAVVIEVSSDDESESEGYGTVDEDDFIQASSNAVAGPTKGAGAKRKPFKKNKRYSQRPVGSAHKRPAKRAPKKARGGSATVSNIGAMPT